MTKPNNFIKGALILSVGGIITKIIGAVYRVPLTNLLGSEGMGLYHLVFPFYTLLLALSSAGIPVALSRLIAEKIKLQDYKGANKIFKIAFASMSVAGIFFATLLYFNAEKIAIFQGNILAASGYKMIAPAIFFVAQIAVLRGYFQGRMNMIPTAVSQIIEQVVKIVFTMTVAISFLPDVVKAVTYSIFAVTISEIVAIIILAVIYKINKRKNKINIQNFNVKEISSIMSIIMIFAVSLPIALGSIVFPLSQLIDSVLVMRILSGYYNGSVISLYGLFTGPVNSLIGLPVVVASGIAIAIVPVISAGRVSGDKSEIKAKTEFALKLTFLIAVPASLGILVFSENIIKLLYGGLNNEEINIASLLLKISSLSILFISLMQTAVSILVSLKRAVITTFNLIVAVGVKISLSILLLRNPTLNIYGLAISAVVCYFTASMLNLFYIIKYTKININTYTVLFKPVLCSAVTLLFAIGCFELIKLFLNENISLLLTVVGSVLIFIITAIKLKVFTNYEVKYIPVIKKII